MSNPLQSNHFSGIFIGQKQITLERTESTNDYLKDELSKSTPFIEGTVIMAVDQFRGKGQAGNEWESQKGKNLTASILLKPTFLKPEQQFDLNIAISLSVRQALSQILTQEVFIKWPNDIYVKNKKIAGILIENSIQGQTWKHAIVGIGVNVNQKKFSSNARHAGSLIELLHKTCNIQRLLSEICKLIEVHYFQLKAGMQKMQKRDYCNHLLSINEKRKYKIDGVSIEGKIVDVDESGRLMMDFNGHLASFSFKEIEYII